MSDNDRPVSEDALPTIYEYCVKAYQAMREEASTESLGPQYGDQEGLVWDGFSTKLIENLDLPNPYYTKVFGELRRMDCIRQLRRGGSSTTSRWLLLQDPTPELFLKMPAESGRTGGTWKSQLEQQVRDLNTRIAGVEEKLDQLIGS